jgi:hypothetical protein
MNAIPPEPIQRPVFTIRLRALPDIDGIKAIRRVLKYALRQCGLRALSVTEEQHQFQEPKRAESERGGRCESPGCTRWAEECHHLHYETLASKRTTISKRSAVTTTAPDTGFKKDKT